MCIYFSRNKSYLFLFILLLFLIIILKFERKVKFKHLIKNMVRGQLDIYLHNKIFELLTNWRTNGTFSVCILVRMPVLVVCVHVGV